MPLGITTDAERKVAEEKRRMGTTDDPTLWLHVYHEGVIHDCPADVERAKEELTRLGHPLSEEPVKFAMGPRRRFLGR